jgi:30S ribosomal protein 3
VVIKSFMQNFKLQVLWLDDSLGLAINQVTSKGNLPLTSYYFWPVSEAWEQIRFELDAKSWISEAERIKLLNLIVDVMNEWQGMRSKAYRKVDFQKMKINIASAHVIGVT